MNPFGSVSDNATAKGANPWAFEGQGGLFHISPQETEPKLVALMLKQKERLAKIKKNWVWLAQFRKWINRHLSVCEISTLNSDHCCHLPTDKSKFTKLWFRPDELTHLAADAKHKATRQLSGALISDLKLPNSDCSWMPHESSAV